MPFDGARVKLGDLIRVKHGFAFKGEHFVDQPTPHVLMTPGNFAIGGGFQDGKLKFYRGPVPEDFVLTPGDLVVTMTDLSRGADTLGYSAVVPKESGRVYLHNQRIGLVEVLEPTKVAKNWLHYLLRSAEYRAWVIGSASGSTVKHTSPSRIYEFEFLLPTLDQQKEAAATLDALEERIAILRQTNATLESIAQAIFKSWFIDFDPVRAKAESRVPEGMDAETVALFPSEFEESELGLIPRGWAVRPIGELVEAVGGSTPDTSVAEYWEPALYNWTSPKDLSGATGPVLLDTERKISEAGLSKISSGLLPVGTLLMSSRAPIGYLSLAQIPVAINQGYIAMLPGGILPPLYLYFWCAANMDVIKSHANGSTFMEISKKAFRPIQALVPPPQVVSFFADFAAALFSKLTANQRQARSLIEMRDVLLPRLVSGKLRLPVSESQFQEEIA